ncbi:MAG: ATP-binding cassette domain-containing protein [Proteobacteria bacterium]|nr:ATP-binding cassette domain-containing protein [Pseudomonadota bacterium]MDA1136874.1 ATP-binding cassette domain-containing protein [Pseudomonadota bacterium]
MIISLHNVKPLYMSDAEIEGSEIYDKESVFFEKGKKYLITANSGHGKTSILNFIYGINTNFNGNIIYSENTNSVFDLRKSKISYIFQDLKLFPDLTVFENIQLKNNLTNYKLVEEITSLIEEVLLGHKKDTLVEKLSLGQKQRVAILRALCQPFEFLLLDEPFSHLDKDNIRIITNIINREVKTQGAGLIMTSLDKTYNLEFDKMLNL